MTVMDEGFCFFQAFCITLRKTNQLLSYAKPFYLLVCVICVVGAGATENLTAISNALRGPIKSSKSVIPGVASEYLEYDRQGRVVKEINHQEMNVTYVWSDNGYLTVSVFDKNGKQVGTSVTYAWMYEDNTFVVMMSETRYVAYIDDGNGRLLSKMVSADGKTALYKYSYDDNGLLNGVEVVSPDGTAPEMQMSVVSENADKYGNATKQIVRVGSDGQDYSSMYRYTYYDE